MSDRAILAEFSLKNFTPITVLLKLCPIYHDPGVEFVQICRIEPNLCPAFHQFGSSNMGEVYADLLTLPPCAEIS